MVAIALNVLVIQELMFQIILIKIPNIKICFGCRPGLAAAQEES